jgi:hypothetical protein
MQQSLRAWKIWGKLHEDLQAIVGNEATRLMSECLEQFSAE